MTRPHGKFTPTTAEGQYRHKVFAQLWDSANNDNVGGWFDDTEVLGWLKLSAFPLLFPGHCFRCHGFENGPCEKPEGHRAFACPGCVREDREHKAAVEVAMQTPAQPIHLENGDVLYPYTAGGDK